jgi:hypothetical protein
MTQPTLAQLQEANPLFFSEAWGDYGTIRKTEVSKEDDGFVLKVETAHQTYPVYSINEEHELAYERHGW